MKKIDPVEAAVVMEEKMVTKMENVRVDTRDSWIQWWWMWLFERWSWWWYGGGGCRYRSGGYGVIDTEVVVYTKVDTFGNFVDETSFTNFIHTISSLELC